MHVDYNPTFYYSLKVNNLMNVTQISVPRVSMDTENLFKWVMRIYNVF